MAKISKFYVEVKKSSNFQTYTCGLEIYLEEGEDFEQEKQKAMTICRKSVVEQIKIDQGGR